MALNNTPKTGRPLIDFAIEDLIVHFFQEDRTIGSDRVVGALKNVGHTGGTQWWQYLNPHKLLKPQIEKQLS